VTVRLLYFAALRDLVGRGEEDVELPEAVSTVRALAEWLEIRHPALGGRLGAVRVAVNEAFAEPTTALSHGDVVALIPPVAGG
jgi:molybdopterin converting factor subunit 1